MFKLGQVMDLRLPRVEGVVEARVVATGGGHTTVAPLRRVHGGNDYEVSGKLRCYADEELEGMRA